jgi:hypothetical protein
MIYRTSFGIFRALLGLSLLGSVAWQVNNRIAADLFRPTEYFAFFSITSSILAGVVLVYSAYVLLTNKEETERQMTLRLIVTVSMVIVGAVYHALLGDSAIDPRDIGYEWPVIPNLVIHTWVPIAIVFDYLLSIRGALPRRRKSLWVIAYPLSWLAFSITRGLVDGWWPYWFINPNSEIGIPGVISYVLAISFAFISLGFLLSRVRILVVKLATGQRIRASRQPHTTLGDRR